MEPLTTDFERRLHESLEGVTDRIAGMRARVEEIDTELHNLIGLAAKCGHSPAVVQAITGLELEKKTITQQLLSTDQDSLTEQIRLVRQFATTRFERLRTLIETDIRKAKLELQNHVAAIRMSPDSAEKTAHYVAEGEWNLLGGWESGGGANLADPHIRLVAGESYVANALRLPFRVPLVQ